MALTKAELDAKTYAVEAVTAVAVSAKTLSTEESEETETSSDVLLSFSEKSIETLTQSSSSEVEGILMGGQVTGTEIISLGEEGVCVVVRFEIPLEQ